MTWLAQKLGSGPLLPQGSSAFFARRMSELSGLIFCVLSVGYLAALATYNPADPSMNSATDSPALNVLGQTGAMVADLMVQSFGLAALLPGMSLLAWGVLLVRKRGVPQLWLRVVLALVALMTLSAVITLLPPFAAWPLNVGLGGVTGQVLMDRIGQTVVNLDLAIPYITALSIGGVLAVPGLAAFVFSLGLPNEDWQALARAGIRLNRKVGEAVLALLGHVRPLSKDDDDLVVAKKKRRSPKKTTANPKPKTKGLVVDNSKTLKTGRKATAQRQGKFDLNDAGEDFQLPPLDLLATPDPKANKGMTKAALEQNAIMLSGVLEDFGVHGEIVKVRPGPVVTLYELEPAAGTKTSRVIGLSNDIARSMSAISVRIATVPGRSVIGIEMPNQTREMVHLRELLSSQDFEKAKGTLNLALGKDIGGLPMIVDLARMPHLLISGTTGSGKSVGVNAMICSLLYQYTPAQCRFIMVDPKMLELSVYDGIPHLLSPVVTEAGKAVVALKWAVHEMEDRYRLMSQLGVRNITGYNQRLADANKKGEVLSRHVQTGFDTEGKPIFEDVELSMEALPLIVVIVDEMADLMLQAGKDVEASIQRLAQMARAAGIHLVMATQRPSVDVITGTIKANFPTRMSYQVTSKIDSRTILGEQGAEQLLGMGDLLYMAGGGRITRAHAPFVSDDEVEDIVKFLKSQGTPQYVEAVTVDVSPKDSSGASIAGGGNKDDALYDEAVALIAREGKASTSFIQRHLQIGYNRAARVIERMEVEGVVSKANRVGKREVLVGDVSRAS